jgi:hypothetical protein
MPGSGFSGRGHVIFLTSSSAMRSTALGSSLSDIDINIQPPSSSSDVEEIDNPHPAKKLKMYDTTHLSLS